MTNMENWVKWLTDGQMWQYAVSHPLAYCPLYGTCVLITDNLCGKDACWQYFTAWANADAKGGDEHESL